ncbi:hypothetical protein ACFXKI_32810 [Streptomyces mirabilis]|uniref:hypothetical protein n=1 Tax=Streptomyces mirabilis TaxID=68239 RepID=UPI003690DF58
MPYSTARRRTATYGGIALSLVAGSRIAKKDPIKSFLSSPPVLWFLFLFNGVVAAAAGFARDGVQRITAAAGMGLVSLGAGFGLLQSRGTRSRATGKHGMRSRGTKDRGTQVLETQGRRAGSPRNAGPQGRSPRNAGPQDADPGLTRLPLRLRPDAHPPQPLTRLSLRPGARRPGGTGTGPRLAVPARRRAALAEYGRPSPRTPDRNR